MNEETTKRETKPSWKRLFLNHHWLVRNIPFFLFLSLLTVLYIYNGHYAEKTIKNINRTARELKEFQYEYKTVKSELMFINKQSEVIRAVEPLGLREILQPPVVLKDSLIY
jgi:hypothetical protein